MSWQWTIAQYHWLLDGINQCCYCYLLNLKQFIQNGALPEPKRALWEREQTCCYSVSEDLRIWLGTWNINMLSFIWENSSGLFRNVSIAALSVHCGGFSHCFFFLNQFSFLSWKNPWSSEVSFLVLTVMFSNAASSWWGLVSHGVSIAFRWAGVCLVSGSQLSVLQKALM